jgi:ABC-type transport system substrate-binding protein
MAGGNIVAVQSSADLLPEAELKQLLAYDPNGAKQLLQQAGLSGWRPKLSTIQSQTPIAELVQAQLKQVGIDSTIEVMDVQTLTQWFVQHDKDFVVSVRAGFVTRTNGDLLAGYRTGGLRNVARLGDPALSR